MTYLEFEEAIVEELNRSLPEGTTTMVKPVTKNNGVILHGLIINDGKCNISPTIYLNYYYKEVEKGYSIDVLARQIIEHYEKFRMDTDFDISFFTSWDKVKDMIAYKLINMDKNKMLLEDVPHIKYLDLAIVFYCYIPAGMGVSEEGESSSILIRNSHMEHWGVTVEDIYEVASNNTPLIHQAEIRNLGEIVSELMKNKGVEDMAIEDESFNAYPMYVLTNKVKLYGACCVLYKNVLSQFAEKMQSNLYIIPSSTHEVLLIPSSIDCEPSYLTELVQQVNASELDEEDILSDHVYYYNREADNISY